MKRVILCAILCIFLIATVSAVNLTPSKIPMATLKVAAAPTLQYIVKPDIHVTFQPSTSTTYSMASLQLNSNPPGAEIWYHNNNSGLYTPYFWPEIYPLITYVFVLKNPGYEPYTAVVTPQSGEAVVISATLVPLSTTTPQPVVSQTPATQIDSIPTNTPATQQVQGQPTSSESTGSLSITTTPAGAVVSVDNEAKGISPTMISGLPPGTHALKITKAGYQDFSTTITIEAGKVREYSTGLTEAVSGATTTSATSAANTPANSLSFPVFAAIIALIGLVIVRKKSR
jgi:hypothetical protein